MHPLLLEGLSDAIGFVGGALLAYWIGTLTGFNPMAEGYGYSTVIGIAMMGIGGGLGLQLARRWRASRDKANKAD